MRIAACGSEGGAVAGPLTPALLTPCTSPPRTAARRHPAGRHGHAGPVQRDRADVRDRGPPAPAIGRGLAAGQVLRRSTTRSTSTRPPCRSSADHNPLSVLGPHSLLEDSMATGRTARGASTGRATVAVGAARLTNSRSSRSLPRRRRRFDGYYNGRVITLYRNGRDGELPHHRLQRHDVHADGGDQRRSYAGPVHVASPTAAGNDPSSCSTAAPSPARALASIPPTSPTINWRR